MAPQFTFNLIIISLLHITFSQLYSKSTCNTPSCCNLNPSSNLLITCTSIDCQLDCTTPDSCSNILYTCGNINDYNILNDTTTCTINCLSSNSCTNLTVMSTSGETYINCNTPNSCQHSNFICNPSHELTTPTECTLDCTKQSCSHINYYCTGYTSKWTAQCNDIQSCNSLDMICDQYININDINTQMECDLLCKHSNDMSDISCDMSSKLTCTESSNAQCQCNGNCNALTTYNVNTNNTIQPTLITTQPAKLSHTFNIIDVEIYAVFTILGSYYLCFQCFYVGDYMLHWNSLEFSNTFYL